MRPAHRFLRPSFLRLRPLHILRRILRGHSRAQTHHRRTAHSPSPEFLFSHRNFTLRKSVQPVKVSPNYPESLAVWIWSNTLDRPESKMHNRLRQTAFDFSIPTSQMPSPVPLL